MAPEDRRSDPESSKDAFDGRDLLVGRPEGAEGRSSAGAAGTPPTATSPQPGAHDEAIREILETVRATAARIDALQEAPGPEHETAEALARERAALTQAVEDARGALAKAAELAAQRDGQASADGRTVTEAAAALKTQGAALDKRLRATGKQAEATARQAQAAAEGMEEMKQTAMALDSRLRDLGEDLLRMADGLRWRRWRFGLGIAAASFVFLVVGVVLQGATDVMSPGDPHHEWNDYVAEHYAPTLAACTSRARHHDEIVRCLVHVGPARGWTVPLYPDVNLEKVPPDKIPDLETEP